jgi:hypothetical protein
MTSAKPESGPATAIRVFIAGEGRNELGGWAGDPAYRDLSEPGVIEAFLSRTRPTGWRIVDGAELTRAPKDAGSLRAWLEDVRIALRVSYEPAPV